MTSFLEGREAVSRSGSPVSRSDSFLPSLGRPPEDSTVPKLTPSLPAPKREHAEKKIETVEVDGVVQKIIVTCGCGERIEIHCGY
jgi:hypothetical protein